MAGSLFLLLDDIATVLDDVATMTKVAAKKTAGVLGDDLALNAEQVRGVQASRELPVVWAVARGSALNKMILVPAALLISAVAPWAITPLLMLGGTYLCFEGAEKLVHRFLHPQDTAAQKAKLREALAKPEVDLKQVEADKIKGAIRTDFILSAEIIVISLGTVGDAGFAVRLGVLTAIAAIMTVGVYGLVAGIVKLDDAGLALAKSDRGPVRGLGRGILMAAPWLMKFLSVAGTAAMFLVGGGVVAHGIPALHHLQEAIAGRFSGAAATLVDLAYVGAVGLLLGAIVVLVVEGGKRLFGGGDAAH
jgi:predicted DNA repair protein MutK